MRADAQVRRATACKGFIIITANGRFIIATGAVILNESRMRCVVRPVQRQLRDVVDASCSRDHSPNDDVRCNALNAA